MIDNGLPTLEKPERHSVHCLVDVNSCVNDRSPFEVLVDPMESGQKYMRGWRLDDDSKREMIGLARGVGNRCSTCTGQGSLTHGFRAVMNATIVNLNMDSKDPPLIKVNAMEASNDLGSDPCQEMFNMTNVVEEIGKNSTLFSSGVETDLRDMHIAHASLILVSWGYLLPLGAATARFFKHRPGGIWFSIHKACQIIGLFLATIGWLIALVNFSALSDVGYDTYRHAVCGMVTMILGLLQPLNAIVRPHAPNDGETKSKTRFYWEIAHKGSGYVALLLSAVTIILGTTVLPEEEDQTSFQIAYGVGIGVLFLIVALMRCDGKYTENTK